MQRWYLALRLHTKSNRLTFELDVNPFVLEVNFEFHCVVFLVNFLHPFLKAQLMKAIETFIDGGMFDLSIPMSLLSLHPEQGQRKMKSSSGSNSKAFSERQRYKKKHFKKAQGHA